MVETNDEKIISTYENVIGTASFTKRYTDVMGGYLYDVDRLIVHYRTPKGELIDVWELQSGCWEEEKLGFTEKETFTIEEFNNGRWTHRYTPPVQKNS